MFTTKHIVSLTIAVVFAAVLILYISSDVKFALLFITGLISVWLFLFLFRGFTPVLVVTIDSNWVDHTKRMVIIRVTIDNRGRVPAIKENAWIQILEHEPPKSGELYSEWVPLSQNVTAEGEKPITWKDKKKFLATTEKIEIGESIHVDLLYQIPDDTVAHLLVQFKVKLNPVAYWLHKSPTDSWTATAWFAKPD